MYAYDVDDQSSSLKGKLKRFKSNHIPRELHKHLNFHGKFDFKGQSQGHWFQTCPKPLDDQ